MGERMPENRPGGGAFDARHYQEYAAREEAREAEETRAQSGKRGEFKAVRPEGPLPVPPKEYRDPSEFKGAGKRTTIEAIREGAAIEAAKEHNPLAKQWEQERMAHEQQLKKWAEGFIGSSPQAVARRLEQQLDDAEGAGRDKDLLSDVSEVLYNLRKLKTRDVPLVKDVIRGMETFLKDQTVIVSPEAKATQKNLRAEARAEEKKERQQNYAREMPAYVNPNAETQPNMAAITSQEQEWFDKGDRGEITDDEDDNVGGSGMVGRFSREH